MLLFICYRLCLAGLLCCVSIHHMLLFILISVTRAREVRLFQYITCYSLSVIGLVTVHTCERFNTSHVTLYHGFIWHSLHCVYVSIHHMLLFIGRHVTFRWCCYTVSIHHMLLFIFSLGTSFCNRILVSIHHMLLFILFFCWPVSAPTSFNTSHVTLYPCPHWKEPPPTLVSIHHMLLFI